MPKSVYDNLVNVTETNVKPLQKYINLKKKVLGLKKYHLYDNALDLVDNEKEYTIDRFENELAVCEDRQTKEMVNIPRKNLPEGIKEGSILKYKDGKYSVDLSKEKEVSDRIKEKMDKLWNN